MSAREEGGGARGPSGGGEVPRGSLASIGDVLSAFAGLGPVPTTEGAVEGPGVPPGAGNATSASVPAWATGGRAGERAQVARMPLQIEPHGLVSQARRFDPNNEAQFAFALSYPVNGEVASWRVTADNDEVVIVSPSEDGRLTRYPLPGPLTHDLFVILGEDANARTRGRVWNVDSDQARTFEWTLHELMRRLGQTDGGVNRRALVETLTRLARLRITASGGAARVGKKRSRTTIVTGLFDRLVIDEQLGATRIVLTLSRDLAHQIAGDFRLLESRLYWQIENGPARRLYRLLDWACYTHQDTRGSGQLRVPVHFLRDRVPIDQPKTAQIVRRLDGMHEELVRVGFLAGMPTYDETTGDDLRRFPTYPGTRARLVSAVYQLARVPALDAGGEVGAAGRDARSADAGWAGRAGQGSAGRAMSDEQRALLLSFGVTEPGESGRSDLHDRLLEVQSLCADRGNVGLYTAYCKALPEDAYRLVVSTVRADQPRNRRAAFVRLAKDQLRLRQLPVPGERQPAS